VDLVSVSLGEPCEVVAKWVLGPLSVDLFAATVLLFFFDAPNLDLDAPILVLDAAFLL
jgi:hypothetical protein